MFSFFKKKSKDTPVSDEKPDEIVPSQEATPVVDKKEPPPPAEQKPSWFDRIRGDTPSPAAPKKPSPPPPDKQKGPAPARATPEPADVPAAIAAPVEEEGEIVPAPAPSQEQRQSWLNRLKTGLSKTSTNLTTLFVGAKIDDDLYDELESALLVSDAGVEATRYLLDALKKKVKEGKLTEAAQVKAALRALLIDMLKPLQKPMVLGLHQPLVMMIAGVNGAGKTTTIGKLAKHLQAHEQSVLLAAGDTFRAAAREQLAIWGERNNVVVIAQESGDPAAVAYDAVQSAKARRINVVMVDTAGRLPTQLHLMEELKKVQRVIGKGMEGAPHEVLLVIDGNTGQNALAQVKAFDDALNLTGLIVTKLDGTAKGGVLAAIAKTRPVPVYFIGVGEKIEDLQPFDAEEFVDALLS
ncbi:MAG TPA: signal recognition particle-docking protein FtsY [Noviherbaspirillum sp.]|uniref:signal recognition particle-docking protein FtsY n=1 Tax=Noviherbaspirillum sp. TaxID=1926288 RepID=UPI002DDD47EE|nr:signal recognition particle-docking protein FtsY [Noviherbaspirillum sp.]HEV2609912.1 signal recognition particle-docking protein FtsY [Noviherbaspirillum sp.]